MLQEAPSNLLIEPVTDRSRGSLLEQIVEAVLYEGHILYPYRPSAKKNRQRFTFGRVYPQAYSQAEKGAEPCAIQTECLVKSRAKQACLEVRVKFLHPVEREVGRYSAPCVEWMDGSERTFQVVPELRLKGELFQSWQETVEREVKVPALILCEPEFGAGPQPEELPILARSTVANAPFPELVQFGPPRGLASVTTVPFSFPASRTLEPLRDEQNRVAGVFLRQQAALQGIVEVTLTPLNGLFKITVRVRNDTPITPAELARPDQVASRTFASTHTVLRVDVGEFISLMDPEPAYQRTVAGCKNIGTWPVLIGDETKAERDTVLSSPIILYDYPKIAPESPGSFFDGTEVDELLTLRIMTMTEDEKAEMRGADAHARRLLERTETMPDEHLRKLHGALRKVRSLDDEIFGGSTRLESVRIGGNCLRVGDRVRLRPKARADVLDLAMNGKTAIIEAVEQDAEQRIHLGVVLEDDPGKDLGLLRQPGHRFFYALEEVEPLGADDPAEGVRTVERAE